MGTSEPAPGLSADERPSGPGEEQGPREGQGRGTEAARNGVAPRRNLAGRLWSWARTHKVRAALVLLGLFVAVELATIPWFSVRDLKRENPGQTALMRQRLREAEAAGKKLKITQAWVPMARISRDLIEAVIVAEDGTFRSHGGVDWFEVRESFEKNVREFRAARGASTITQQLAKNLYLSTSKDPLRKAKELVITLLLEQSLSKDRILEIYLNVIEWGRGVFGVEAAARTYFGKSAASLTLDEALRLAAVIPSPLRHAPNQESRYVLRRAEIVRRRLEARASWRDRQQGEVPSLEFPEELQGEADEQQEVKQPPENPAPAQPGPSTPEPAEPGPSTPEPAQPGESTPARPDPAIDTSRTREGGEDGL